MNIIKKIVICLALSLPIFFIASYERAIITVKEYQRSAQFALLAPSYDRSNIVVDAIIDSKPTRYISFITDGEKNHYVIKQKRKGTVRKQFQVVYEIVSAHIAAKAQIPAHHAELLPADMKFPGKIITDEVASILTLVPGIPIKFIKSGPYSNIQLRQTNNPIWPTEQLGLNEKVIASMGLHPDLASIAALHTFIGNEDCHGANCFYDEETNRFYAIDMDKIYNTSNQKQLISKLACDQIQRLLRSKKVLTKAELKGLKIYQQTLQRLVTIFPPDRINELLDTFATFAGFTTKAYLPELEKLIARIKASVVQSHEHTLELIVLLSRLIRENKCLLKK